MSGAQKDGLRSLMGSSAVYLVGATVARGAKFLLIPIYVRTLTGAEVGVIVVLEAVMIALTRLFGMALGQSVKRYYHDFKNEKDADAFVASIWWLGTAVALVIGLVLSLVTYQWGHLFSRQILPFYLSLAVLAAVLKSNFGIPLERYIVRGEPVKHSTFSVLQFLTTVALTLYLVIGRDMGVAGVLWAEIISSLLWNPIAMRSMHAWPIPSWPREQMRKAVRYSLPALPHALFTWGITFSDRIILERLLPLTQVALYGIGYQLASAVPTMSLALVNAWIPRFFKNAGEKDGLESFNRIFTIQMAVIVGVAMGVFVFGADIIRILATSAYLPAVPVLRVVAVGLIFHGAYQALLLPLFYKERTRWVSIATGTALTINITANLLLIPRIGIMGAAWATVLAYVGTTIIVWAAARHAYEIRLQFGRLAVIAALATASGLLALAADTGRVLFDTGIKLFAITIYFAPLAVMIQRQRRQRVAARAAAAATPAA
jgi:O-antigen/teichoic acid export membrane protein